MIKNGIKSGFLNEEAIIESLMSLKELDQVIVSYFSLKVSKKISSVK